MTRRAENERKMRQNMSNGQREHPLSRRRENHRRRKEQEKQAQTSRTINSQSRVPFQNFTNMTFPLSHFQETHDSEVGPSRITHVNDVALGWFKQLSLLPNISEYSIILKERPSNHHQYNLPTVEQVAASIVGYDADSMEYGRDINGIRHDGNLKKVQETKGYYDPLQYLILFPFGTHGWDVNTTNCNGRRVSCRAYYSYMLQIRPNDQPMLLNEGRLLQQYIVDNYVKIESGRLRWIKEHQSDMHVELYQGLQDVLHVGETNVGPTSWEYLLTNNDTTFNTFKKSADDRGFLETGHSIRDCLVEATSLRMSYALRRLFVTILIFCEPTDVRGLWNEFFTRMAEDYQTTNNVVESNLTNMLLKDLNELLNLHGKKIEDYDLPPLPPNTVDGDAIPSLIEYELAVDIPNEDIEFVAKLNNYQMIAFKTIMNVIIQKYREIVLATASSGIAATLLPGGRTTNSRFKIPIDIQSSSICGIQKQKDLANLTRVAATIIWDEAPMTNKNCLEALDRSLQDICSNSAPFGGNVLIRGGGIFVKFFLL
ncbi:hypothetical protein KIW84_014545 [Lathyrus oleraceus]|uniref:ATP-dependent DNA helicase n=1 Tax=Pisum sativum TaxID=3888 RepID=A0A9D5BN95_PEA|nr:hypothetical protein KIW84_014545 [Pisum sativum]